jgi:hypothetical protein
VEPKLLAYGNHYYVERGFDQVWWIMVCSHMDFAPLSKLKLIKDIAYPNIKPGTLPNLDVFLISHVFRHINIITPSAILNSYFLFLDGSQLCMGKEWQWYVQFWSGIPDEIIRITKKRKHKYPQNRKYACSRDT